jgi:hypothetical protein
LLFASSAPAFADVRAELDIGVLAEHISGGLCSSDNGFGGPCPGVMAPGLELAAGQALQPARVVSVMVREIVSNADSGAFGVFRGYVGIGARLEPARNVGYIELTVGGDVQLAAVPAGEARFAVERNWAGSLRMGVQTGRWSLVAESFAASTNGELGLADYGFGALVSRAFGN